MIKSNKLILKIQQRFRSKKHNVFGEKVSKISLIANNIKRIQSIDSIETGTYGGASNDLICKKEETKCNNIIEQCKKWLTLTMLQNKS